MVAEPVAARCELRAPSCPDQSLARSSWLAAQLSRQFSDHREQRHVQRNNDASDADAEEAYDDRLQHGQHVFGGRVDFVFIEVCDLLQHGVHGAGGFANADHLGHHVGEDAAFAQRIDDGAAFFDRLAHLHQRFFKHGIARGSGSDGQAYENRNARGNERAQGSGETGDCDLAQQHADDGQLEQHGVEVIAATRMLANLLDAEEDANAAHDKEPPEMTHEGAKADDDAGRQRKRNSQSDKKIGEDRHHPLEQRGHDHHSKGNDGDRVDQRRLDGRAQLDRLFHVDGQALENDVENTAGLARLDHVGSQVVEDDRKPAHGIGQRRATFDGGPDTEQGFLKGGILLVGAENLQTLHQRQTGVNHDGELAEEHRNFLDLDLAAAKRGQGEFLALLPDRARRDPLLTELRGQAVLGRGYALALNFLARSGLPRKRKNRHGNFLLMNLGVSSQVSGKPDTSRSARSDAQTLDS